MIYTETSVSLEHICSPNAASLEATSAGTLRGESFGALSGAGSHRGGPSSELLGKVLSSHSCPTSWWLESRSAASWRFGAT